MAFCSNSSFHPKLQAEIEKACLVDARSAININNIELQGLGNFTISDCETIKEVAAKCILPLDFVKSQDAQHLFSGNWLRISLDCPAIDNILDGGIPVAGITELSGESAVGKTQFCLQLSLTVQYPKCYGGLGKSAAYLCTEDRFPSTRLQQLLTSFPRNEGAKNSALKSHNFSDNVFVDHIADVDAMLLCLNTRLPNLIKTRNVGVVIIDSIAALFRSEYTIQQSACRAKDLREIGLRLHYLNKKYSVAILCVNQFLHLAPIDLLVNEAPTLSLDWDDMSRSLFQGTRSSTEIKKLWDLYLSPLRRKCGWSDSESQQLLSLAKPKNVLNWSKISESFEGKSEFQCFQHKCRLLKSLNLWSVNEVNKLERSIDRYKIADRVAWIEVSKEFNSKDAVNVVKRGKTLLPVVHGESIIPPCAVVLTPLNIGLITKIATKDIPAERALSRKDLEKGII